MGIGCGAPALDRQTHHANFEAQFIVCTMQNVQFIHTKMKKVPCYFLSLFWSNMILVWRYFTRILIIRPVLTSDHGSEHDWPGAHAVEWRASLNTSTDHGSEQTDLEPSGVVGQLEYQSCLWLRKWLTWSPVEWRASLNMRMIRMIRNTETTRRTMSNSSLDSLSSLQYVQMAAEATSINKIIH